MLDWSFLYAGLSLAAVLFFYRTVRNKGSRWISTAERFILITGCDTGFGHYLAKRLDERGCNVFATCLNDNDDGALELKRVGSERIRVIQLDVTSGDSVKSCLDHVKQEVGQSGLWAIVNNAGVNILGDIELCTMDIYKSVAEVNLYGMVRVTKAFLPLLRKTKGRVLNVTSVKGLLTDYHNSAYVMTKYGGEAFSDALRTEMHRFGIKVSIIEPGDYGGATGMLGNMERHKRNHEKMWSAASEEVKEIYGNEYIEECYQTELRMATASRTNLEPVIDAMEDALFSVNPSIRYLIDGGSGLFDAYCVLARLKPFLPETLIDYLVRKYL